MSDVLFAIANVLSFAKATFIMPAFQLLGPLQITFTRMLGDIMRFMVLFSLVLFAFMVGLHNLYWYYGSRDVLYKGTMVPASEPFEGYVSFLFHRANMCTYNQLSNVFMFCRLKHTLYSLFWCMFGQVSLPNMPVRQPGQNDTKYSDGLPSKLAQSSISRSQPLLQLALKLV